MGYARADHAGKPVTAIINIWSEINPCHSHFQQRPEEVKRGVWQAGGLPVEMPTISLSAPFQKPTTMLYRNLLAIATEELLRSYPGDGCVLMGGCDKTTPGQIMGASSMNLPAIFMPAGPMLRGHWRGDTLGRGSDVWKYWAELRAGNIGEDDWAETEQGIARSPGHCMTMGTASTMTSATEAMGLVLPGAASIPAADSRHAQMASGTGRRAVEMVWEDLKPGRLATRPACAGHAGLGQAARHRRPGPHRPRDCPPRRGLSMAVRYRGHRPADGVPYGYEPPLLALADWADLFVLACVGGPSTRHRVSREVLATVEPEGVLVNIERVRVVDEPALVEAPLARRIVAAARDVFDDEPDVPPALLGPGSVVLARRIASAMRETWLAMAAAVVANLESGFDHGALTKPVVQEES